MTPARIEGDAFPLGKPANWNDDENGKCSTLWVRRDVDQGVPFLRSAWDVDSDEAGWLLAGAKVQFGLCVPQHPVINVGLGPIPEDFAPPVTVQQIIKPNGGRATRVTMFLPNRQKIFAEAWIGDEGLGAAVKFAIDEIEALARREGWL